MPNSKDLNPLFNFETANFWRTVLMFIWKRCARFSVNKPCLSISPITCASPIYRLVTVCTRWAHIRSRTCRTISIAWALSCNYQIFTWQHFIRFISYCSSCLFTGKTKAKTVCFVWAYNSQICHYRFQLYHIWAKAIDGFYKSDTGNETRKRKDKIDGLLQECSISPLLMHWRYCSLALNHR